MDQLINSRRSPSEAGEKNVASDSDGSQLSRQVPSNDGVYSNETGATATVTTAADERCRVRGQQSYSYNHNPG